MTRSQASSLAGISRWLGIAVLLANSEQAMRRLALIETVSVRIGSLLRGDQIRIVRWVRKAFSNLVGRRPLDLLMDEEADIQELMDALTNTSNEPNPGNYCYRD